MKWELYTLGYFCGRHELDYKLYIFRVPGEPEAIVMVLH